ncbi:glycosyl-4,4'-diaponeurosporenoate acyltransferase CrtO family protein [Dyadobacter aurulentus]|uniref:glycosyl-4,4'-diaponeurosporenoate acyltransferase CrtO family protein n=1 Tax=Dyadobacter sp. UC 10 TaxID=2605428 RepID=UPI0011F09F4B|nr:hypothetical protein [Dyadobacter sp. UC 10]KAA0991379.1 hypothetical protein FXO21_15020 [Dyadobacter sp. UC 10]
MRKPLTLTLIIIITIALIYGVSHYIDMQGFSFAWIINFLLMGCVLYFTETLKSPLTSAYYQEKAWEKKGKIYEYLGINIFRKILIWVGWERLNKKSNPIRKNTQTLLQLHYRTKQSEFGHVIIFIIVLGFNILVAFKYGYNRSMWLLVLNILLNLYPIFLQRYNRPRIERAINLSKRQ